MNSGPLAASSLNHKLEWQSEDLLRLTLRRDSLSAVSVLGVDVSLSDLVATAL